MPALARLRLCWDLTDWRLLLLATSCEKVTAEPGEVVVSAGAPPWTAGNQRG